MGVCGGEGALDVMVNGAPDALEFPDTSNSYFQSVRGLDVAWATGVVSTIVNDDWSFSEGGDGAGLKKVVDDAVGAARDVGALSGVVMLLEDTVDACFDIGGVQILVHLKVGLARFVNAPRGRLPVDA